MLVFPAGSDNPLRGDLVVRAVLRSDLTPIPQTVELEVRESVDTDPIQVGAKVRVGRAGVEFEVVKDSPGGGSGLVQGDRPMKTRKIVGIMASCAAIAKRSQRSVVRNGAALGEIYRACGAQVQIEQEFSVGTFACFAGMTPSFEIAKALQEEAGALVVVGGKFAFRRLAEMLEGDPVSRLAEQSAEAVRSEFLEQHMIPAPFSTTPAGEFISARNEAGRGRVYRPRADARILGNLSSALVTRRKLRSDFAPKIMAGMRVDVANTPLVVVTAAHVYEGGADGGGDEQYTGLWLGEFVQ